MTVTVAVYDKGEKAFERFFPGKPFSIVTDYLKENLIPHETDKENDDVVRYTKDNEKKIIWLDNTNILGVDGNEASWVSEYWIGYDEDILKQLIRVLENE